MEKFSMANWTYPDGDPIKVYDERVLNSIPGREIPVEKVVAPRFSVPWNNSYSRIFLGGYEECDCYHLIPAQNQVFKTNLIVIKREHQLNKDYRIEGDFLTSEHPPEVAFAISKAKELGLLP